MTTAHAIGGRLAALIDLGLTKLAQREFAPGIPTRKLVSRLPKIVPETLNRWALAVQDHEAARAGRHFDLRLVDPDAGKAHSWAIPKARLPSPGERLLAVQTFTHTPEYALNFGAKKPQTIEKGYGKGRVRMALKTPTDIIEASNDKVRFNTYEGRNINEYILHRTHDNKWLLQNVTITKDNHPEIPQSKPSYKEVAPNKIDVTDDSQVMMAKVDGAHNTFLLESNKPLRIFSHRPSERDTGLIEHSHRFVPGLQTRVPKHLDGYILRGELFAADPHTGRTRQAVETGAILNSGVWKSREAQQHSPLRAVIFDVARNRKGRDGESIPYKDKLEILKRVNRAMPILELPPMASTAKEKINLLNRIRTGQEPITSEGVVMWPLEGGPPVKAKFRPDHDVYVRRVFPETGKREGLAGGFAYSWTPQGKVQGRVGTGFTHEMKRDMLANPEKYIGRVARVQAQDLYRDKGNPKKPGALRAAAFQDWHLDRNMGLLPVEKTAKLRGRALRRLRTLIAEQGGIEGLTGHSTTPKALEHILRDRFVSGPRVYGVQGGVIPPTNKFGPAAVMLPTKGLPKTTRNYGPLSRFRIAEKAVKPLPFAIVPPADKARFAQQFPDTSFTTHEALAARFPQLPYASVYARSIQPGRAGEQALKNVVRDADPVVTKLDAARFRNSDESLQRRLVRQAQEEPSFQKLRQRVDELVNKV